MAEAGESIAVYGFLRCPDFQLVSASPELLVELRDGKLATRPIAGTRQTRPYGRRRSG